MTDVSRRLGKSATWVTLNARRLGGYQLRTRGHPWRFPETVITHERALLGVKENAVGSIIPDQGLRAARIYELLESGKSQSEIVRSCTEPPDFVAKVRAQWISGYESDRRGLQFPCACGAVSSPHTAKCPRCAARSRILSDAELAALSGTPLGAKDCLCSGCRTPTPTEGARHVCPACEARLGVVLHDGKLTIVLGAETVRELTAAETRALLAPMIPAAPPPPPPPAKRGRPPRAAPTVPRAVEDVDRFLATQEAEIAALEREMVEGDGEGEDE